MTAQSSQSAVSALSQTVSSMQWQLIAATYTILVSHQLPSLPVQVLHGNRQDAESSPPLRHSLSHQPVHRSLQRVVWLRVLWKDLFVSTRRCFGGHGRRREYLKPYLAIFPPLCLAFCLAFCLIFCLDDQRRRQELDGRLAHRA